MIFGESVFNVRDKYSVDHFELHYFMKLLATQTGIDAVWISLCSNVLYIDM